MILLGFCLKKTIGKFIPMMKNIMSYILKCLKISVMQKEVVEIFNAVYSLNMKTIKFPYISYCIVTQETKKKIKDKLTHNSIIESLPTKSQLPKSEVLNWRPELSDKLSLKTALDYRALISSNQYVDWFGNQFVARVNVSNGRSYWRLETMRQMRAAFPSLFKGKVIEVGAGTGLTSCEISTFDETEVVYCLDYDEYTVENLMPLVQSSLRANVNKIKRVIGSYNNINVIDNYFDAVVAVGSMHHSEDIQATMAECFRVLKPGGNFIISDYALTGSLSQEEYNVLSELPLNENDAINFEKNGNNNGMATNASISEHERPYYLYLAAAFNAGFNITATFFDATKDNGGVLGRLWRRTKESIRTAKFYEDKSNNRVHGYDKFGNVRAFSLANRLRYPSYAKDAPSLINLIFTGDYAGKPIYDNMVLKLQKPINTERRIEFEYPSGKRYCFPVQLSS